jgi:tol-pal system protein YbgF
MVSLSAAACGPSLAERQAQRLAQQVEALSTQLGRAEARLSEVSQQVVVLSHDRLHEPDRAADAQQPTPPLKVVRLTPEPEPEPVDDTPPVQLVLHEDAPAEPVAHAEPPRAGTDAFRHGLEAYGRGATDAAYRAFEAFVQAYPTHPDADSAQFWMGQCKLDAGAYGEAIAVFERLCEAHPDSAKVPDALLQAGLAYEKLQATAHAQTMFALLVKRFPRSAPAELARARLRPSVPEVLHVD